MRLRVAVMGLALCVGCSSSAQGGGSSGSDEGASLGAGSQFASMLCANIAACDITVADCQAVYEAVVLSPTCQTTFLQASCGDLSSTTTPPDLLPCLPACTITDVDSCNGNGTLTACANDQQITLTCPGACAVKGLTFTGTCSSTYMGAVAANGEQCWCQ
jgi:hypothetical protein